MPFRTIAVETSGDLTIITLDRLDAMNTVNAVMQEELERAFNDFAADDTQRVAIITGSGDRAFCAGSDLKEIASGFMPPYPAHGYAGLAGRFDLTKPLIAAIEGVALGGGFEIALACDIIIASEGASFGLPEPRVGALALGGGIHRLSRQIGYKRAMGFLLTGRRMTAQEAFDLGLVNEIVNKGCAVEAARGWASEISQCAPLSVQATKDVAQRGLAAGCLEDAMRRQTDWPAFQAWANAEDTREGPKAFAEKREIKWQGR